MKLLQKLALKFSIGDHLKISSTGGSPLRMKDASLLLTWFSPERLSEEPGAG
jgi:hypothetical protein